MSADLPPINAANGLRTIAVAYNEEEYFEFNLIVLRGRLLTQSLAYVVLATIVLIFGAFVVGNDFPVLRLVVVTAGVFFLLAPFMTRASMKATVGKVFNSPMNSLQVKRATTINPKGVFSEGQDGSYSFTPWTSVAKIEEGKLATYVFISSHSALIVPRRAFPDDESYRAFVDYAQVHLRLPAD